jgi:hypothetical protein
MIAPLVSGPTDPVSNFIQHTLLPLWPSLPVIALMQIRKIGSAVKMVVLDGIRGFDEVFCRFCDSFTRCSVKWRHCKELRAEDARPPEKVKALARRAGAWVR